MTLGDYSFSEVDGGYRIGTLSPSANCDLRSYGFNQDSSDYSPVTPSKYNGKDIIEIGRCAFRYTKIIKITISAPVRTIENCVFHQCYYLQEVIFPSTVSTISHKIFWSCSKLSIITFCRNEAVTIASNNFDYSNLSVVIKVPINSKKNEIGIISTKKVLNPSCLQQMKNTYKRRNRIA